MLPNSEAIKKSLQIALILNCNIPPTLKFWRKHYNWPDLPKGYQNTMSGTYSQFLGTKGEFEGIGIREVHLEEDPAAWNPETGTIDYNRSGAPLVEIVTEPDFKSSEQVETWLKKLVLTLSYIRALDKDSGIKADVNVSLHGERIEIKNINSIQEIKKAIDFEAIRQEKEKPINKETRRWTGEKTIKMREKESHADYRFIKDPDLPIIPINKKQISDLQRALPETPMEKLSKLIKKHKISEYNSKVLINNLEIVELFENIISKIPKEIAVPWITIELIGALNYNKITLDQVNLNAKHLISILNLIKQKKITELNAKDILRAWIKNKESKEPGIGNLEKIDNKNEITKIVKQIIKDNPKAVEDYKTDQKALNFQTAKELLEKELK